MPQTEQTLDYQQLRTLMTRAVARVCPDWLRSQQEDLVQIAMEKIFSLVQRSEGNRTFNTSYLMKIAHSVLVDEIRSQQRRQEVSLDDMSGPEPALGRQDAPPAAQEWFSLGEALKSCLHRMIATRRQAVSLHLQGHSVAETAQFLGWGYKKAENCVYRGLADLRACLKGKGFDGAST